MIASIKVKVFGVPKLIEAMGKNGEAVFEFLGGTVNIFFHW